MNQSDFVRSIFKIPIFCLLLSFTCCQQKTQSSHYLGVVNIDLEGDAEALAHFEKGLLLLHSFEYKDSREEFIKAQEADPGLAMAYWGEAMTYNHSLWGEQDFEAGSAAINKLKLTDNARSVTEMEKDFIKAVELLYQPEKDKTTRDKDYADHLLGMYKKYHGNHEVASFYALALLGSVPEGRDEKIYGQGALIADEVLRENPRHPGALHYLIHSYDDPGHAHLALDVANRYAKVAPDASHALHMPSHIYVALGMWDEVVSSNEQSYQASLNRMERKKLSNDARGYHAYHWLEYGYLQKGRVEDARKMVLDMQRYATEESSKRARTHLVFLKGTFLVETDLWDDPIADIEVEVSDLNVAVRSQYNFLEGMKAYKRGDSKQLKSVINVIHADYENETYASLDNAITVCASATREATRKTDITESKIMEMQLFSLLAWLNNDHINAEKWLKESVVLEESLSYSYGPPFIQKPTHELYAEWLLSQERAKDALAQYEIALKRGPNRRAILNGIDKVNSMKHDLSMSSKEETLNSMAMLFD